MDKETKRRIGIMLMGIIGVIALLSGVSYAAFSSNLAGTQIQGVKTGCLKVDMADNGNLSLTNQAPETDQNGLLSTPYTYTITNTCTTDAYYTATINVLDTSNLENISKIKVSLDGDSYLAPTIESELEEIPSVDTNATNIEKTYKLDEGYLKVGQTKTFDLRTWIDYDVTEITGKLSNKVIISSKASGNGTIDHPSNTPGYQVLSKSELLTNASYQAIAPNGDQLSGVIKIGEGENAKYYFRGNPNNYITFAGKTFRILSTNSDGSINIVLDSIYRTSTYGNLNTILTSFYNEISSEEKYIKTDQTFCEEKQDANGEYLAKLRVENYNPTTSCASSTLTKVGLLTADALMYAGAKTGVVNTSFYLKASDSYYTTSHATSTTVYGYTTTNSIATIAKTGSSGIKPVITLKSDTLLYGEGTSSTPFYVSGTYGEAIEKYQDDVAPTIVYARVDEKWSNENKQISISAKDNPGGSGIAGYLISTSNTKPGATSSSWEASSSQKYNSVKTYDNGNYYVFVKDEAGNISEGVKVTVEKVDKQAPTCTIRINPNGTETTYKTLTILSDDTHIDLEGYSWEGLEETKDVIKVEDNGVYTGYLTDLAGNQGSCSATVTSIIDTSAANLLKSTVGTSGLEEITHEKDSTLQIGANANLTEYRFRGGNDVVTNNYVYFNCEDMTNQTADTCDLYRIIGVFPTEDEVGKIKDRIKLIKNTFYNDTGYSWDTSGINNWTRPSTLNTELNNTYYQLLNEESKQMIGASKYYLARNNTTYATANSLWVAERKTTDTSGNPVNSLNKIGLMYTSDFGYAAVGCEDKYLERTSQTNGDIRDCKDDNWLFIGSEWTINARQNAEKNAFIIHNEGYVGYSGVVNSTTINSVRPVFYLNADVEFNDVGDGSINNPYQLINN